MFLSCAVLLPIDIFNLKLYFSGKSVLNNMRISFQVVKSVAMLGMMKVAVTCILSVVN